MKEGGKERKRGRTNRQKLTERIDGDEGNFGLPLPLRPFAQFVHTQ